MGRLRPVCGIVVCDGGLAVRNRRKSKLELAQTMVLEALTWELAFDNLRIHYNYTPFWSKKAYHFRPKPPLICG